MTDSVFFAGLLAGDAKQGAIMDTDTSADTAEQPQWEELPEDAPPIQSTTFVASGIRRILAGGIEAAMMETEKQRELDAEDAAETQRRAELEQAHQSAQEADWMILPSTPPPPHAATLPTTTTHSNQAPTRTLSRLRRRKDHMDRDSLNGNYGDIHGNDDTEAATATATAADTEATEAGKATGSPAIKFGRAGTVLHPNGARWRPLFLAALRLCPNVRLACEAAAVSRGVVDAARDREPAFAAEWAEAMAEGVDLLHACVWQRATEGVLRPIYQGGVRVGYETVYSDKLAIELLRAHRPEQFQPLPLAMKITGNLPKPQTPEEVLETVKRVTPLIRNRAAS